MRCTNCGWDNADSNTKCEKCGYPLGNGNVGNNEKSTIRETIRETIPEGIKEEERVYRKIDAPKETIEEPQNKKPTPNYGETINPWASPQGVFPSVSYCKLSPMPIMPDEKHMPSEVELKGEKTVLKRGNIDPDNMTISQDNQAILTCKNGKWYIKDLSLYKTTYVHAGTDTPLKNGDIILMGNRRFVFTED